MAYFKQIVFGGIAPAVDKKLLPDNYGQQALDADLSSGKVKPLNDDKDIQAAEETNTTKIYQYRYGNASVIWLGWTGDSGPNVSVVPGPIANDATDRLYWTGDLISGTGANVTTDKASQSNVNGSKTLDAPGDYPKISWSEYINITGTFRASSDHPWVGSYTTREYGRISGIVATSDITPSTDADLSLPHKSFRLGVPAPSGTLTLIPRLWVGTSNNVGSAVGVETDTSYAMTWVTIDGREGPPIYSDVLGVKADYTNIEIVHTRSPSFGTVYSGTSTPVPGGPLTPNDGINMSTPINRYRIYKSQSGSQSTQYQFLSEHIILDYPGNLNTSAEQHISKGTIPYPTYVTKTVADDVLIENGAPTNQLLGEVLPSATWIGPPDDNTTLYPDGPLQGLCSVGQGVFAGFTGQRLCFSEPYIPHAWPIAYRITLNNPIVAIRPSQGGLVVLTKAAPYFIYGTDPSAMTATQIDFEQPCINARSVVTIRDIVYYAAPDGLCAISGTSGQVVTEGLVSREQWNPYHSTSSDTINYYPTDYNAFNYRDTYVAFPTDPTKVGFAFDPSNQTNRLTRVNSRSEFYGNTTVKAYYEDPQDSEVYFVSNNNTAQRKIKQYRAGTTGFTTDPVVYKSSAYTTTKPASMAWLSIDAGFPFTISVFADGVEYFKATFTKSSNTITQTTIIPANTNSTTFDARRQKETIIRLPAVKATQWEVEISSGNATTGGFIDSYCIAETLEEVKGT